MTVRVYSTPICPVCYTLKQFLQQNNVEFEEIDVSQNKEMAEYMIQKTGQIGVPVLEIDGQFLTGFDREKISQLLKIKS